MSTAGICPECGSKRISEPDREGLIDCFECGIWFDPDHPNNTSCRAGDITMFVVGVRSSNNPDDTYCIEHNPMHRADLRYVSPSQADEEDVCSVCRRSLNSFAARRLSEVRKEEVRKIKARGDVPILGRI